MNQGSVYLKHPNFYSEEEQKWCLVRCPECDMENYALAVTAGVCVWCGYNANADKKKEGG